ncbi:MAPEG family protein [Enterovirga aerilata]|uniref:MAPEG family protein n=1 Tax=Enterovirga aerilata TaxID=2730920 RepID=A0A849HZ38_9HYPH|nr:MAPEG family protein [Enterovirga sp. DB1703]NNM72362.1 MAPEG family protein [Enterovirga sp. DB1703]
MSIPAILLPVFVQVALTFALLLWTGSRRLHALRGQEVRPPDVALSQKAWPAPAQQAANAFGNQFELPVLFYVLVVLAIFARKADLLFVVLSWIFVATRFVHAGIYLTTNYIPHRFGAFLAGAVVLMIMWIVFAVRILAGPWPA